MRASVGNKSLFVRWIPWKFLRKGKQFLRYKNMPAARPDTICIFNSAL